LYIGCLLKSIGRPISHPKHEHFQFGKTLLGIYYNIIIVINTSLQVVLTLRAKGAAALWVVVRTVVRMVVRAAGVCGKDDERTAGTTGAPACSGFDVPSSGDRDDVSSGSRRCLARR